MTYHDLFEAVHHRNLTAVKHCVEIDGVGLRVRDERNDTVVHIAAKNNDLSTLKYLFKKDPFLFTVRGYEEMTLTQLAVRMNSMALLKFLIEDCKTDIYQEVDDKLPETCVHWCARLCNIEMFKYFIEERGVDVNLKDPWAQPLAFLAARGACIDIIKYIIQTGKGDLTTTDAMDRNILCQSAVKCDLTVPKYLLDEKKINIDLNNTFIIQDAIVFKRQFPSNNLDEFMKYFVEEKGMNVNNGIAETPLHKAAKAGMLDVVKYLIKHGADVKRKDNLDQTPLQVAKNEAVIEYLREKEENRTRRSLPVALQSGTMMSMGSEKPEVRELPSTINHTSSAIHVDKSNLNTGFHYSQNILLLALACINSKSYRVSHPSLQDHIGDPIATDVIDNLQL